MVADARALAKEESSKTTLDVVESKKTAAEQILKVKEETANEVAKNPREHGAGKAEYSH